MEQDTTCVNEFGMTVHFQFGPSDHWCVGEHIELKNTPKILVRLRGPTDRFVVQPQGHAY